MTGGSNSIKNSYTQYRELGARTRAMLQSQLLKFVSLPSFVLADPEGVVRATSDETELAAVEEVVVRQATTP